MNIESIIFVAVTFFSGLDKITVFVANDYIKADNNRYFRWSSDDVEDFLSDNPSMTYPLLKVVDETHRRSVCKLKPYPIPVNYHTRTNHYKYIKRQKLQQGCSSNDLTAGHKKDVVKPTDRNKTAIYGWHRLNGEVIQPYSQVHGKHYRDYSHGFRPMLKTVFVNGKSYPHTYLKDKYGFK